MSATIKGVYRNGKIELLETPPATVGKDVEVLVTFLEMKTGTPDAPKGRMIQRGMYKGPIDTTDADFKEARESWM